MLFREFFLNFRIGCFNFFFFFTDYGHVFAQATYLLFQFSNFENKAIFLLIEFFNLLPCSSKIASVTNRCLDLGAFNFEFLLLLFLARHQGLVVSRDTLAREVCGIRSAAVPYDNVIDVNLSRLRAKLADAGAANLILTVRGLGYQLAGVA